MHEKLRVCVTRYFLIVCHNTLHFDAEAKTVYALSLWNMAVIKWILLRILKHPTTYYMFHFAVWNVARFFVVVCSPFSCVAYGLAEYLNGKLKVFMLLYNLTTFSSTCVEHRESKREIPFFFLSIFYFSPILFPHWICWISWYVCEYVFCLWSFIFTLFLSLDPFCY